MALLKVNNCAEVHFLKPSTDKKWPWVVLCYDPAAQTVKWPVWLIDGEGNTTDGGYHTTLEEAKADFDSRAEGTPIISN